MNNMAGFQSGLACKITGVKRVRLQTWIMRGFITPSVACAAGHGTRNVFNAWDLYSISLMKKMIAYGFSREMVARCIHTINWGEHRCNGAFVYKIDPNCSICLNLKEITDYIDVQIAQIGEK